MEVEFGDAEEARDVCFVLERDGHAHVPKDQGHRFRDLRPGKATQHGIGYFRQLLHIVRQNYKVRMQGFFGSAVARLTIALQAKSTALVANGNLRLTLTFFGRQQKHIRGTLRSHPESLRPNTRVDKRPEENLFLFIAGVFLFNRNPASALLSDQDISAVFEVLLWLDSLPDFQLLQVEHRRIRYVD